MANKTFLEQWVSASGAAAQSPAKQHEFSIYIPQLLQTLSGLRVKEIVDFQADEGVVSVAFCAQANRNHATFVLPSAQDDPQGTFKKMAEDITEDARQAGLVTLVADMKDVQKASADAILFNNILGCQGSLQNLCAVIKESARVVKSQGYAVVTVPNPISGHKYSTYTCTNVPRDGQHGATYNFKMRGETESFKNLFLTEEGLTESFNKFGFKLFFKNEIADKAYRFRRSQKPAFMQYVFQKTQQGYGLG